MQERPAPPAQRFDMTDRVVVVTGGSRGLGREMVRAFAASGAHVVIASRKAEACEALAAEIRRDTGREALPVACHVGRWEDCDRLADAAWSHFGRVDVLVNNAGMSPTYPSLVDVTEELYDKVLAVNLRGPFRLSALLGARMAEGRGGAIVNVSSVAAVQPTPGEVPYGAAKAGLHALTFAFARAYAPRVRVNCIMAGPFETDISRAWTPQLRQGLERAVPLGRIGAPGEIVGAALYLASDASSYTTGAVLKVDGGLAWPPG